MKKLTISGEQKCPPLSYPLQTPKHNNYLTFIIFYSRMKLVIVGFETDAHKDAQLALGAYVIDGGKVSYLQVGTPTEGQSYCYTSYNSQLQ